MQELTPFSALSHQEQQEKWLDQAIHEWLVQKFVTKSRSEETQTAYRKVIDSFRARLWQGGIDLLDDPKEIARVAPIWAATRAPGSHREGLVSDATYNQRLAILSSFYTFLEKTYRLQVENPIKNVEKRRAQSYKQVHAVAGDEILPRLASIDTDTLQGKRDMAILGVGLMTGRRATEILSLSWKHVTLVNNTCTLFFERCKGNKQMRDLLDPGAAALLFEYLRAVYGDLSQIDPEAPLWISFSDRKRGKRIGYQTLADICKRYLETTQTHALRRSFAKEMEKAKATLSDIQHRLGHESILTTALYLRALTSEENKFAPQLAKRFGIAKFAQPKKRGRKKKL